VINKHGVVYEESIGRIEAATAHVAASNTRIFLGVTAEAGQGAVQPLCNLACCEKMTQRVRNYIKVTCHLSNPIEPQQ
jgi:hypothetical protein